MYRTAFNFIYCFLTLITVKEELIKGRFLEKAFLHPTTPNAVFHAYKDWQNVIFIMGNSQVILKINKIFTNLN